MKKDPDKARYILVICGAVPLVLWRLMDNSIISNTILKIYLLTATLFVMLLADEYPPFGSRWFWKSMIPVLVMHSLVVAALVASEPFVFELKLTRIIFGFLGVAVVCEWWASLRIIEAFRPHGN